MSSKIKLISIKLAGRRKTGTIKVQQIVHFIDEMYECKVDVIEGTGRRQAVVTVLVDHIESVAALRKQLSAIISATYPHCPPPRIEIMERDMYNRWHPVFLDRIDYAKKVKRKRVRRDRRKKADKVSAAQTHPGGKTLLETLGKGKPADG